MMRFGREIKRLKWFSNAFLVYVVKPTMTGGKGSWLLTRDAKNSPFTLII